MLAFSNANKDALTPHVIASLLCSFLGSCALGVCAIVIALNNKDNSCATDYDGISFSCTTWLLVFGATTLGFWALVILLMISAICVEMSLVTGFGLCVAVAYGLFSTAWMIIGSVLYFHDVHDNCPTDGALRQFGLAVFIIWVISIGGSCCSARARRNN